MAIVVTLSPELEALLRARADQQGQDVDFVVSKLLENLLEWEAQDSEEAIEGLQSGLGSWIK